MTKSNEATAFDLLPGRAKGNMKSNKCLTNLTKSTN